MMMARSMVLAAGVLGATTTLGGATGVVKLRPAADPPDFGSLECRVHKLALDFGVSKVRRL